MEYNSENILIADSLEEVASAERAGYVAHAFCTAGSCEIVYNDTPMSFRKGDIMIVLFGNMVTAVRPASDFRVRVIYISVSYMETCTPHTSYGITGGLSLYRQPIMCLNEEEQHLCESDFDAIIRRMESPLTYFHGDMMMAVTQTLFIDLYEFHARQNGEPDISALTASIMRKFINLLEQGEYYKSREVTYYAGKLCITPKYLSEVTRRVSGFSANAWIDRFTCIKIVQLLKDKSLSLTDITYDLGFSSPSHFTRYVQKNLGVSPTTFRE
ncbi:MAG: AraC family transcriptional regulator [Paludibacteraceae bacterium]|nr:AraC family transcriptional regulator [Paludibacteraceae bacterium]